MFTKRGWQLGIVIALLGLFNTLVSCSAPTATHLSVSPVSTILATHGIVRATKAYLATKSEMATDTSVEVLKGDPRGGTVAKAAPTIDFGLVAINTQRYGTEYGDWGNVVLGPDGKYYFCFGDHSSTGVGSQGGGQDGSLLVSYDPSIQKQELLVFSKDVLGPGGEGKWHGRPGINPATGDMYLVGFYHGHVVRYNIYSRRAKDLGAPVPGAGWPEYTWDWQRERLYGVGDGRGSVLVYDTKNQKVIHQGQPVDALSGKAFSWDKRVRLLDRETGNLYGTDSTNHLTKYDAATNTFTLMKSTLRFGMRAWTERKDVNGAFWIFDERGNVYKFYPEQDRVEYEGKNWGPDGWYVTFIEESGDGHYLYYSLSAPTSTAISQGQPIIQYNTQTKSIKVLAFLANYYASVHHYQTTKIYGGALSADGSSFFVISNGNEVRGPRIPSMFDIHIPASERGV